jgi:hypothetical protein
MSCRLLCVTMKIKTYKTVILPVVLYGYETWSEVLRLLSTTEELLERKSSGSGLENRKYDRRDPSSRPHDNPYPQMLTLTSPTSSGTRSV